MHSRAIFFGTVIMSAARNNTERPFLSSVLTVKNLFCLLQQKPVNAVSLLHCSLSVQAVLTWLFVTVGKQPCCKKSDLVLGAILYYVRVKGFWVVYKVIYTKYSKQFK